MYKKGILELIANTKWCPLWIPYTMGIFCSGVIVPLRVGYGRYRKFRRFLDISQWWSYEQLKNYQIEKLKCLLTYVYNNVPYYRELFQKRRLTPDDFNSLEDLRKLPILTKKEVRDNFNKLITTNLSPQEMRRRLILSYTSGSTGTSMCVYLDREYNFTRTAFDRWYTSQVNTKHHNAFFKYIQIWSRPFIKRDVDAIKLHTPYTRALSLSSIPRSADILNEYLACIKKFKPTLVTGPPSFLYLLACYARDNGYRDVHFPMLYMYYENLYSFQRDIIARQFQCEIFNCYTSIEDVISARECNQHEGMHIEVRKGIMEIVGADGEQLPYGERGRIICTGFYNDVMPLIRYDSGDIGTISDKPCSCGRGLPLLKSLDGRTSEVLKYKDKIIYPSMLSVILEQCENIQECQFVQEKEEAIKVQVVRGRAYTHKDTEQLMENIKNVIDANIIPVINFVDTIPRTGMGKFQFVINRCTD